MVFNIMVSVELAAATPCPSSQTCYATRQEKLAVSPEIAVLYPPEVAGLVHQCCLVDCGKSVNPKSVHSCRNVTRQERSLEFANKCREVVFPLHAAERETHISDLWSTGLISRCDPLVALLLAGHKERVWGI